MTWTPPPTILTKLAAGAGVGVAHGAARPRRREDLLAATQRFAPDLLAERHALLADADAARFWPPELVLLVCFSVHGAAITCQDPKTNRNRSPWEQELAREKKTAETRCGQSRPQVHILHRVQPLIPHTEREQKREQLQTAGVLMWWLFQEKPPRLQVLPAAPGTTPTEEHRPVLNL